MAGPGKRYRDAAAKIDRDRLYGPTEGFTLLKDTVTVNYDPTIDVAIRLGIDPRKADQMLRGAIVLPHGTGKTARVAVIATGEQAAAAQAAGADVVGSDDVIERLGKGELLDEIDAIVATPDQMGKLGRLGKLLGPRGLMPNPKSGTVRQDVAKAVEEIKAGKVEYRSDRFANVHAVLGKASFGVRQLLENYQALMDEIIRARPASAKGRYVRTVAVSTSMGPSIRLDPTRVRDVTADESAA